MTTVQSITPPFWLLAELTYACPLHCAFCSNPVDFAQLSNELSTQQWVGVFEQARALGSVQLGFSGGEPLMRKDLDELVGEGHRLGYYTNLITSGIGLNEQRIKTLKDQGLDHIQLSFQDSTREINDFLSSTKTFDLKRRVADLIKANEFPMVLNCVIHRLNIDHIGTIIDMAVEIGAEFLELANTQYYGWAYLNRTALIPTREQLRHADDVVRQRREQHGDRIKIIFVIPDYFEGRPKRCMNGWASTFLSISPDGTALPCQAAKMLPGFDFPNVRDTSIQDIWYRNPAMNRYRGDSWMPEPCRSCPEKSVDLGGCRCQAFLLTGDSSATDPACNKSPDHHRVVSVVKAASEVQSKPLIFRSPENSRLQTIARS